MREIKVFKGSNERTLNIEYENKYVRMSETKKIVDREIESGIEYNIQQNKSTFFINGQKIAINEKPISDRFNEERILRKTIPDPKTRETNFFDGRSKSNLTVLIHLSVPHQKPRGPITDMKLVSLVVEPTEIGLDARSMILKNKYKKVSPLSPLTLPRCAKKAQISSKAEKTRKKHEARKKRQ